MSFAKLLMLAAVGLGQVGSAGEPPPKIARFLEQCEGLRRGAILQIEHSLRGLRGSGAEDPETRRRIRRLEEKLHLLETNDEPVVPELRFPPQVGEIGRFPGLTCQVEQVLSDQEVLVRCSFPVTVAAIRDFKRYRETIVRPVQLVLRGQPAERFSVGAQIEMLAVFEITGRDTYRTEKGGSKTLLVVEEFDLKQVQPYLKGRSSDR